MKKLKIFTLALILLTSFTPTPLKAGTGHPAVKNESLRANELIERLNEIDKLDKSTLSRADKKELRKEVKSIKKELKALDGGIYLSVGAIIIIVLLLILLL